MLFDRAELLNMLTYCRPAGSPSESVFIRQYVQSLPNATIDTGRNWHVTIGNSPILWSCHTDTVHRADDPSRQTVHYNRATNTVHLSRRSKRYSHCLGADDTAGVFLLRRMILAGIPGHYVFHFGEEIGGIGSTHIASRLPATIASSRFAIALDRRGTSDVITHQGDRCASHAFAESLAAELNRAIPSFRYAPSDRGLYTDTANYTDAIGECTNLSVGYSNEHTTDETLNLDHLERLLDALTSIDPARLVSARRPGEQDPADYRRGWWTIGASSYDVLPVTTLKDVWMDECYWCGQQYDCRTSKALDSTWYCSIGCEREASEWHTSRTRPAAVPYLDPDYEAVQRALSADAYRRLAKVKGIH